MKKTGLLFIAAVCAVQFASAQTPANSIAQGLGIFVFPANGQSKEQQDADELACLRWAREQSGFDPLNPTQVQAAQVNRGPDGTAVVGAARGAAAGAAIGAIAGDAGRGAAIGAVAGGLSGRRQKVVRDEVQQQQNNRAAAGAEQQLRQNFNRAFSACMSGKGYTVN